MPIYRGPGGSGDAVNDSSSEATLVAQLVGETQANADAAASSAAAAAASASEAVNKVAKTSNSGSAIIPTGTTAQRDETPLDGYFRYNSDLSSFEGYVDGTWGGISGGGGGGFEQTFLLMGA